MLFAETNGWLGLATAAAVAIGFIAQIVLQIRASRKIEVIHKATNSMKDELVKEVRAASFAAGEKSERDKP